jgi:hypothetical protein
MRNLAVGICKVVATPDYSRPQCNLNLYNVNMTIIYVQVFTARALFAKDRSKATVWLKITLGRGLGVRPTFQIKKYTTPEPSCTENVTFTSIPIARHGSRAVYRPKRNTARANRYMVPCSSRVPCRPSRVLGGGTRLG